MQGHGELELGSESMRAVYRDLLRFGPRSRSDLAARLGLSAPTITRATRDLLAAGRLRPLDVVARAKGRPQEPLDVVENDGPRFIGVKVTAEDIHTVVTTVRGNPVEELTLPLTDTAPEIVQAALIPPVRALAEAHPRIAGVGVSVGGPVVGRRTVLSSPAHLLDWDREVDLASVLEERLHLPVVVENDLLAMVHGLHWFGIGRAYRSFAVLTVGAGIGTGIVIDGRLVRGHHHVAGLTGRFPVGVRGDGSLLPLREVASTEAILRSARAASLLTPAQGIEDLRRLLAGGDPRARALTGELARHLAAAVAGVIALVDPEAIILGGESIDLVRGAGDVFEGALRGALSSAQQGVEVRELSGTFDEWARGAAVIAIQEFVGHDGAGTSRPGPGGGYADPPDEQARSPR